MFHNSYDIDIYNELMDALKKENQQILLMQQSKEYKLAKTIRDLKNNIKRPAKLVSALRWRWLNNKIKEDAIKREKLYIQPNYFSDYRIAIYTVIFGRYDIIAEPVWTPDNCEFFIITDQNVNQSTKWKTIRVNNEEFDHLANNKDRNRFCKMLPFLIPELAEFRYTIYLDGNISPITDLTEFVNLISPYGMAFHMHSFRNCTYEEARICEYFGLETKENIKKHVNHLHAEGFPINYGLLECNVIVRDNSSSIMRKVMHEWWSEYCSFSKRDQLSLPYVLYKNRIKAEDVGTLGDNVFQNYALRKRAHI